VNILTYTKVPNLTPCSENYLKGMTKPTGVAKFEERELGIGTKV